MDNEDCDLLSIVRSCNASTLTTPTTIFENPPPPQIETTTNNITFPQSVTPFCFDDFTFNQENNSISFAPLKPNDFIDLDKLMINFNLIPTPATTSMPKINTTTTSSPTTTTTTYTIPSPLTTAIPTHITNINTSVHIIHTPTITTPTSPPTITPIITTTVITPITTTSIISATSTTMTNTSVHENNQYPTNYNFPILAGQQQIQQNIDNQAYVPKPVARIDITAAHFECAYNHPSIITSTTTAPIIYATSTIMTNTSVHENNQYPTNYNFPILVGQQQIQQNINNQVSVPKPVTCIDNTTVHFERVYNHQSVALCGSRKRKYNNQMALVCYIREDELSKDSWAWRKYGQKPIKGSPHPRSYYKCSTWTDCPARRKVEKCKTQENTYIVTYEGEHNHAKPTLNKNVVVGTSQRKSPKTGLHSAEEVGSSTNITNSGSPNVVMLQIDHPESSNAQALADQPKTSCPKMKLVESQLPGVEEVGSSSNVRNLGSHNKMILQFDERQSSNVTGVVGSSNLPYSEIGFVGSFDDNDNILIPNITAWSEDYLMNFNRLNGGALFP